MDFVSWLDDKIVVGKRLGGLFRKDIPLEDENDDVKILVKNVGQAVVGIPDKMGQWRIIEEGGGIKLATSFCSENTLAMDSMFF